MSDVVYVAKLPNCDIHYYERNGTVVPAAYDGKTKAGPWANMCESCMITHGIGVGTGKAQKYIVGTKPVEKRKPIEEMSDQELSDLSESDDLDDYL